ncbi:MAG: hypothetical protein AB7P16_28455 [Bradyrhizobium sp.]|uniref:virion core protein, T7 gp14 family n=1 Tax=Bradyrhizobium sp. TaxID=376 RepID=UPI003D0E5D08
MSLWDSLLDIFGIDDIGDDLMTISTATDLVSTGLGVYGAFKQADAVKESAKANAATYDQNQVFAEAQARDAVARGRLAERKVRLATRSMVGAQRAALAANNVRLDEGSALDLQQDTALLGEADAFVALENARREAQGYRQQGLNYAAQAAASRSEAGNVSPFLAVAPTIVGGAASVADRWLRWRSAGGRTG